MKRFFFQNIITIIILFGWQMITPAAFAQYNQEYTVKAAMIRNFAKFTRWPKSSISDQANNTITVCLMGEESLLESFAGIRGKKIGGRSIDLQWIDNITGLQGCRLLFIDKTARSELSRIMENLQNKPVLTIGETEKFSHAGGMITFFIQDDRIRFQINPEAARRAGLTLSSNLLELAVIVNRHPCRKNK
jgi:hypothetical protein